MDNQILDKKEILTALGQCTLWHPSFEEARRLILKSIDTTATRGDPSSCMLIGEPGVGKTKLCKLMQRELGAPSEELSDRELLKILPCIYLESPKQPTIKSIALEIANELGVPPKDTTSSGELEHIIIRRLKTHQTKLLIIDEIHRLIDQGSIKTKKSVCRFITTIQNESGVPILLSGAKIAEQIIDEVQELSDRYPFRARLDYLPLDEGGNIPAFLRIIASLQNKMINLANLNIYPHLTDDIHYKAIYLATKGNFRHLMILLDNTLSLALSRNDASLRIEDFASAATDLYFCKDGNPFIMSASQVDNRLRLIKCTDYAT